MSQIEDVKPLSKYERQKLLNASVRANTDFECSDQDFFANTGRLLRVRPPHRGEHAGAVELVRMAGLTPMIVVKRSSTMVEPRAFALLGLTEVEHQDLMANLPRMGESEMLDLLGGSPKTLYKSPVRWWLLVPEPKVQPAKEAKIAVDTEMQEALEVVASGAIEEAEEKANANS